MSTGSTRAIFFALGANLGIAVAKGFAAALTGSGSLTAEAIHSVADCANQLLLLIGVRRAARPPTDEHPLGWGKESYFWSLLVAVLLFSVGGLFSLYEGLHKLSHPEPIERPWIALTILAVSIVLEAISFRSCLQELAHQAQGQPVLAYLRESRDSELLVLFGEDLAALVGLGLAGASVALAVLTGAPKWDALGSVAIGSLLLVVAAWLLVRMRALVVGQSAHPKVRAAISAQLASRPEVVQVFGVLTLQMGQGILVAIKARMRPAASGEALVADINAVEKGLREACPSIRWLFFEPDVED
jgi:cation diffusion facilitator family transporter